jgi:xylulokinase
MTEAALGIDLGLTGARAALVRADGSVVARSPPAAGGPASSAVTDAGGWPGSIAQVVRSVVDAEAAAAVRIGAIAVSAAGPQPIPVDERLRPLLPAVLAALDRRPVAERERLASERGLAAGALVDHAIPTLLWWREHAPDAFGRAAYALDATGYLVSWLTGEPTMDRITRADYVLPGLEPPLPIPAAREPLTAAGRLTPTAAAAIGVESGIPVAVGTYDSYIDLHSLGGDGRILLGSTMVVAADSQAGASTAAGDLRFVVLPGGERALSGWTSAAGSTLAWSQARFGGEGVAALPPGAGGLVALPYLSGERTPVWDPHARGAVVGLTGETSAAELGRAFLDAVALSARDIAERMRAHGHSPARWRVAGGGIHDAAWLQATSDAVAAELDVVDLTGGIGAGIFALRMLGRDPSVPVVRTIAPEPAAARRYDLLSPLYRELYPRLRATMHALGELDDAGYQ